MIVPHVSAIGTRGGALDALGRRSRSAGGHVFSMTGVITRWSPALGIGELLGADRLRYVFAAPDIASSGWPPSAQDALDLPWVPAEGCVVEFAPALAGRGCLGRQAVRVMRRRPFAPSASRT